MLKATLPMLPGVTERDWVHTHDNSADNFDDEQWDEIREILGREIIYTTSEDSIDCYGFTKTLEKMVEADGVLLKSIEWECDAYLLMIGDRKAIIGINGPVDIIMLELVS